MFDTGLIEQGLTACCLPYRLLLCQKVDSSNAEVLRRALHDEAEGLVLLAEQQSAGRGRIQRSWHTDAEASLAFSLLLRPQISLRQYPHIPLLVAVAVYQALAAYQPDIGLKWPNDVLYQGAKLAGVLTQMHSFKQQAPAVVVGIGINVLQPAAGWPMWIEQKVCDLQTVSSQVMTREQVLVAVLTAFDRLWADYQEQGFESIRQQWLAAHVYQGQQLLVANADSYLQGIAEGLDHDGALLLRCEGKLERILAGDVSKV